MWPRSASCGVHAHSRTYIFKGSLVQELNSLTAQDRLLWSLCILFLFLFCRFSGGGGWAGVRHSDPKVFRDRESKERKRWASIYTRTPHADTPASQNGAPPTVHHAHLWMRQQAHSPVCGRQVTVEVWGCSILNEGHSVSCQEGCHR